MPHAYRADKGDRDPNTIFLSPCSPHTHTIRPTMSSHTLDSFEYGKSLVRLLRVVRDPSNKSHQSVIEYTVQTLLSGPRLDTSYTEGDNTLVVATDSQKNTVHYLAKTLPGHVVLSPEHFGLYIANHFPTKYPHITTCQVDIIAHKWSRVVTSDGKAHPHSFVRDGEDKRVVSVRTEKEGGREDGKVTLRSLQGGLKDLLILKSSGSAFHSFLRDEFTTLKEVNDRIFSTSVDCKCELSRMEELCVQNSSSHVCFPQTNSQTPSVYHPINHSPLSSPHHPVSQTSKQSPRQCANTPSTHSRHIQVHQYNRHSTSCPLTSWMTPAMQPCRTSSMPCPTSITSPSTWTGQG